MSQDLTEIAARLQRLEDTEAIRTTWLDYCRLLDAGDLEGLGNVFTDDAVVELEGLARRFDGRYEGRAAIIADLYQRTDGGDPDGAPPPFTTGHLSTNIQIELEGDEATTLAYFFEIVGDGLVLVGTYQHRLRREADRWRVAFVRIGIRYRARLSTTDVGGQSLQAILAKPT
ncbi:MAG: nuclear transport factor 2 family protein [Chloroflexi bacterium]|nr:nuclear transport factor 2 family protein [Chloroflexota bacterium]